MRKVIPIFLLLFFISPVFAKRADLVKIDEKIKETQSLLINSTKILCTNDIAIMYPGIATSLCIQDKTEVIGQLLKNDKMRVLRRILQSPGQKSSLLW